MFILANGNGRQVTQPPLQSELWKQNTICVFRMQVQANGNGRQVMRPLLQGEFQKQNAICVFITELQVADSIVRVNERSAEYHKIVQGLTFMCQNACEQGSQLQDEKEGQRK